MFMRKDSSQVKKNILALICFLLASTATAADLMDNVHVRNLELDDQGYYKNIGSDGHMMFGQLNESRAQACGLLIDMQFKQPLFRAGVFDVFWRAENQNFSERRKSFVVLNQLHSERPTQFLIPLCKLYSYSGNINRPELHGNITGLRFDYPPTADMSIKFNQVSLLSASEMHLLLNNSGDQSLKESRPVVVLEPFERLSGQAFTSLDVVIPKLFFALEHGLKKLFSDIPFLVFWLLLILSLKLLFLKDWFFNK